MFNKKLKNEKSTISKIKLLPDKPIAADREQDMRFGHRGIVSSLRAIVGCCPIPFTIGLFGKWGCGKTTILNGLRKKINEDTIATVNFDVWKHEGDSLRRSFLEELFRQAKNRGYIPKNFELNVRLKTHIQKSRHGKFVFDWKILVGFIVLIVSIGIFLFNVYPKAVGTYLSIIFGGSFISSLFLWIVQQTVTAETLTTTLEPFRDPHEFEEEFERITNNISSRRLLIIIDNLDRCTHNRAVELLSTIKTFLAKDADTQESNKCIFLIACDDEAIRKHLRSVYIRNQNDIDNKEAFSADEFLRKFFNTFLRIPDFIDTELQNYTSDLLRHATDLPQFKSPDIADVITIAFRENPRQIKQFINILLTHFLLAQERESGQEALIAEKGTITNNVAFLAKFLIIHQLFPQEYKEIKEKHLTIKEMENIGSKDFKDFLKTTKLIKVDDIRPFIYLKQSKEELTIPSIRDIESGLIDNNQDVVKEKLKSLKSKPEQINSLKGFIVDLMNRHKDRRLPLLNVTSCSLETFRYHGLELSQQFYDGVADLLNSEKALKPNLQNLEPSLIFKEVLSRCKSKEDREGIIAQYIKILGEQKQDKKEPKISVDYAYKIFKELVEHEKWLKNTEKQQVKQILRDLYFSILKILALFKDKIENQTDFISEETISNFVGTFSEDDVENKQSINEKTQLLLKFKEIIKPKVAQNIISSLQNLLTKENQKPYREEKQNLLVCIGDIFEYLSNKIAKIPDKNILNTFSNTIKQGMDALPNWDERKIFIFTCLRMINMLEDAQKTNIDTLVNNFFANTTADSIKFVFDILNQDEQKTLIEERIDIFNKRVKQDQTIFDLLYPIASEHICTQWLEVLIISYIQRGLAKLEELKYKVYDKKRIIKALLDTAQGTAISERAKVYEVINKMKCANDAELRNNLVAQIKPLLKNGNNDQQQVGYSALEGSIDHISATARREIARETIEWLRSLEPATAAQQYSIRSIILNWDIIEQPVKADYMDFIFDKLIKRGISIDNIRLGFEILFEIKPKYEESSVYFDDVFVRLKEEDNEQIKTELKSGLLKLKPQKTNEKNKDFWNKLENTSNKAEK